jgi:hypothetical protein
VLGSFSEYFRKRITGFKDDPSTLKQPDGRLTLVVEVEEELTEAAHDVIKLMYHLAVPQGLTPRYLAKVSAKDNAARHEPSSVLEKVACASQCEM